MNARMLLVLTLLQSTFLSIWGFARTPNVYTTRRSTGSANRQTTIVTEFGVGKTPNGQNIPVEYQGKIPEATLTAMVNPKNKVESMIKMLEWSGIKVNYDGKRIVVLE